METLQVIIREYTPEDRLAIEKCAFELQEDEKSRQPHIWKNPEEQFSRDYYEYVTKSVKEYEGKIFVAEIDGEVAGHVVVILNKDESPAYLLQKYGYILDLVVLREYQRRGIGNRLMVKAEEFVRSLGLEWMQLDVSTGNPAHDFYTNSGYREKDVRMEKKLGS